MQQITINSPLDMHLHLRDNDMLKAIAKYSATNFSGALIMPNLVPPVSSKQDVIDYKERIKEAIGDERFTPYMSLFFNHSYTKEFLSDIKSEILAIKLYPAGITTNSKNGVSSFDIEELKDTLEAMSDLDIPLCIHGESNGFVMDREKEFAPIYESLAKSFPKLKIIMEHITTKTSVELLDKYDNLYATITLHHLLITLDDVAGGLFRPHLFCKPIAKRPEDREALIKAVFSNKKVMFGSDSAPHPREEKESCGCGAGVFSAPIIIEKLTELFDTHNKLDILQDFISSRAIDIYNITPLQKSIILEKQDIKVPSICNGVVPFCAKESISWSIIDIK
jgi:dihydroorotase